MIDEKDPLPQPVTVEPKPPQDLHQTFDASRDAVEARELTSFELDSVPPAAILENPETGALSIDEAEVSAASEEAEFTYERIGNTPFFIKTRKRDGFKQIVQPPKTVRPDAETILACQSALDEINAHNAALGHPTQTQESLLLAMTRNALATREYTLPKRPPFAQNQLFALAQEIKQESQKQGKTLSSRNMRRLLRKKLKKKT